MEAPEDSLEQERALKWFLLLSQAYLRAAHRGGAAGRSLVASRFNAQARDDWGSVFHQWVRDKDRVLEKLRRREQEPREEVEESREERDEKTKKAVVYRVGRARVSKGTALLDSDGVADTRDPEVMATLRAKYRARGPELPATVHRGQCVDNLSALSDRLLKLKPASFPGSGGMRPEFLTCLAQVWQEEEMELLENFGMLYLSHSLPAWFDKLWLSQEVVALFKTKERLKTALRPIGMRTPLLKVFHKEAFHQNRTELTDYLEPQQLGLSKAGGHQLVHSLRMVLEERPDHVCFKMDFHNAHTDVFRRSVVSSLLATPTLRHLAWHAACVLAPASSLESRGEVWGEQEEGEPRGIRRRGDTSMWPSRRMWWSWTGN